MRLAHFFVLAVLTLAACSSSAGTPDETSGVVREVTASLAATSAVTVESTKPIAEVTVTAASDPTRTANVPKALPGWERYRPNSFGAIISQFTPDVLRDGEGLFLLGPKDAPAFRARVIYTGKSRVLTGERQGFVKTWGSSLNVDKKFVATFALEFLFSEGDTDYWIPVQTQLIKHFKKELKAGDEVIVYSIWIGSSMKSAQDIDWIFLVNEFQSL